MVDFDERLAIADVVRLRQDFSRFAGANAEKAKYYDGKNKLKDLGDRKSTRLNSSHWLQSRMPSSA